MRILAFAGSTRLESFNNRLVRIAESGARDSGATVTHIDLRDYRLPLFDQDEEAANGKPDGARALKQLLVDHDGLLIASPEYNSSVTGVLKNTIDWVSRPDDGDPFPLVGLRGKVVALMSASPGALGGLRGLVHLRSILGNLVRCGSYRYPQPVPPKPPATLTVRFSSCVDRSAQKISLRFPIRRGSLSRAWKTRGISMRPTPET